MSIRLAFFVDSMEVGGSELNAIRTLEHLDRSRFELSVFHTGSRGPLLARYQALGIPLHHVPLRGFLRPGTVLSGIRLARTLRHQRIQILHSQDIYSNIMSIPWARLAGTEVIIASRRWQGAVPSRGHARANRIATRWATRVLANSTSVARSVVQDDGIPAASVKVIPNFVDSAAFEGYPADRRELLWSALGIPPGSVVVGSVARLAAVKDHATLLRALISLFPDWPELHLLLIGDGPLRTALQAQADASGWAARIHLAGTQPNHPNPHALLDISVLSSLTEGFPNAVVEAMAAGRPVVASDVGGTPEAVLDGHTGILVPAGDAPAMARALHGLLASSDRRRELGAAGQRRARAEYHADKVIGLLSDWYGSLLRSG